MTGREFALEDAAAGVWDVIILGAGPAGAIAAGELGRRGARTLLVDRKAFPRAKVCGACLNLAALEALRLAGLGELVGELRGIKLETLELALATRSIRLPLPGGMALSRARFDAALVDAAASSGAIFLAQTEGLIGAIHSDARRVNLMQPGRKITALARVVVIATGLGQARFACEPVVSSQARAVSRIGAGCTIDQLPGFDREGTIYMAVGDRGYVGWVRLEDGCLNVAAVFERNFVRQCGNPGAAAERILSHAGYGRAPALRDASWQGTLPLTRQTRPIAGERLFVVGDATGYDEPFTGDGMARAMVSGEAIVPLVAAGIRRWDPALPRIWGSLHRRVVSRRQLLCRGIAALLNHPKLARPAFGMIMRVPEVAQVLIRLVNSTSILPLPK
jgi:flavin-dependent dehydrogenase